MDPNERSLADLPLPDVERAAGIAVRTDLLAVSPAEGITIIDPPHTFRPLEETLSRRFFHGVKLT
jgi:hypothetical protein